MAAVVQGKSGRAVVTISSPTRSIDFDQKKSTLLSFNVGNRYGVKDTPSTSSLNASPLKEDLLASTLVNRAVLLEENVLSYNCSQDADYTSKSDMQSLFLQQIAKVSNKGLFVFAYTGPAVEVDTSTGVDHSLKLLDFDPDNGLTHVSPDSLLEWLSQAQTPPCCVIFILDCPFARELTSALTDVRKSRVPFNTEMFAIGAQLGVEKTLHFDTLGNQSIFAYFLSWAFRNTAFTPGNLPLEKILRKAETCTTALSSLIVTYDDHHRILKSSTVEPKTTFIKRLEASVQGLGEPSGEDETDSVGGIAFLTRHFIRQKKRVNLHQKVLEWLYLVSDPRNVNSPLGQLYENGVLESDLLLTAICAMMFSVASFQVALIQESIADPNLFIIAFVSVIATVEVVQRNVKDEDLIEVCKRSWEYYHQVLTQNKVKDKRMKELFHKIENEKKKVV